MRGEFRTSHDLASHLYRQWRDRLGPDDHYTLNAALYLARTWGRQGHYVKAREQAEDTLARRRLIYGEDHPDSLIAANSLASTWAQWVTTRRLENWPQTP